MAAGIRAVVAVADLIDIVIEVRDARVPRSTAVADLHPRLRSKSQIALLNRADLAEDAATAAWLSALKAGGRAAFSTVGTKAATLRALRADLLSRPRKRAVLRVAVVGAPNTGKSSVINGLSRHKRAVVADKAGVTRHVRWLKLETGVELLDTPGLLPPRIVGDDAAWQLSLCGSLPETAFDVEETVAHLHAWLARHKAQLAASTELDAFAQARGMRRRGGELDRLNAARKLVSLFRAGKLFRATFEMPGHRE
jgi:ribosome biogenesis GTPase A